MASVTSDCVSNRVNLSGSDIGDSVVTEFIVDACAGVMLETGLTIDYSNCTETTAACITDLAAPYCLTYITGESDSGKSFTLGDLSVREVTGDVQGPSPAFLQQRVLKIIEALKAGEASGLFQLDGFRRESKQVLPLGVITMVRRSGRNVEKLCGVGVIV